MRTHSSSYPDQATAEWCTQQVVSENEHVVRRWLAQGVRQRLTIEAAWPSRPPVGRVLMQGMVLAGRGPVDVHAARVILLRDPERPNGFSVHSTFPVHL